MSRIRTLKPEWLEDEKLAALPDTARLLSVGLILLADDQGRGRANPALISAHVWPYDAAAGTGRVKSALEALASIQFVVLYAVGGQQYYQIRNWEKHQRVNHPGAPRLPGPEASDEPQPEPDVPHETTASNGRQKQEPVTDAEWLATLAETYDHVDVPFEHRKMLVWCATNKKAPSRKRFINWLNKIDRPLPGAESEDTIWDTAPRVWGPCEGNPNCPENGYHLAKNPKSVPVSKRCPLLPASEEVRL